MREFLRKTLAFAATPALAGAILTVLAPLGTQSLALGPRALYWVGLCFAGGYGAMAVRAGLQRFAPHVTGLQRIIAQSLGSTAAVAPFVIGLSGVVGLPSFILTLFYIWLIAMVITSFGELADHYKADQIDDLTHDPAHDRPALMDRLPMALRSADFYAAQSEDHYLRLYTSRGEYLILMRLSDVEDLVRPLTGLSPHRSWWVAEAGVRAVRRENGKTVITLKDNTDVPVSRSGAQRVKQAGWRV